MSCTPIKEPVGVLALGTYVVNIKDIPGWFDYSTERVMLAGSVGSVYKVEKMEADLAQVLYCIHFKGFGYVNVKHCDLELADLS